MGFVKKALPYAAFGLAGGLLDKNKKKPPSMITQYGSGSASSRPMPLPPRGSLY